MYVSIYPRDTYTTFSFPLLHLTAPLPQGHSGSHKITDALRRRSSVALASRLLALLSYFNDDRVPLDAAILVGFILIGTATPGWHCLHLCWHLPNSCWHCLHSCCSRARPANTNILRASNAAPPPAV